MNRRTALCRVVIILIMSCALTAVAVAQNGAQLDAKPGDAKMATEPQRKREEGVSISAFLFSLWLCGFVANPISKCRLV
jgi:hypothetical protein